jgi:hypothetical protein
VKSFKIIAFAAALSSMSMAALGLDSMQDTDLRRIDAQVNNPASSSSSNLDSSLLHRQVEKGESAIRNNSGAIGTIVSPRDPEPTAASSNLINTTVDGRAAGSDVSTGRRMIIDASVRGSTFSMQAK